MWGMAPDDQGISLVTHFTVKPATVQAALKVLDGADDGEYEVGDHRGTGYSSQRLKVKVDAATRLFIKFVGTAASPGYADADLKRRLKYILWVDKMEEIEGVPSLVQSFNGKPVLITKSATMHEGTESGRVLEIQVKVQNFGVIGRKMFNSLRQAKALEQLHLDFAWTVQGELLL